MTEILMTVEEAPEGGFTARAVDHSIFTEADTLDQLRGRTSVKRSHATLTIQTQLPCDFRSHTMFDRIICDPQSLGGKPIIKGTRISVAIVLEWLASGATAEEIVAEYTHLTLEDIQKATAFAAPPS